MSDLKHCGFCALLSGLMRRAMCIGSRRGSSESYYRELGDQDTLKIDGSQDSDSDEINLTLPINEDGNIEVDIEINQELFPSIAGPSTSGLNEYQPPQPSRAQTPLDAESEGALAGVRASNSHLDNTLAELEALRAQITERPRWNGRFHSLHKRRRRRLVTRALLSDEALLDDLFICQVQTVLNKSSSWNFNAFTLDNTAGGRGLSVLCVHLFEVYGLIGHFHLDPVKVWKLVALIEENYHSSNPYHNSVHAADVTQAMHCFLQQNQILVHLEPIEVMAGLLAAIAHDVDHPGVNQPFLVATSNHLVALYQSKSVLENHHWRSAISCLIESNIMADMPQHRDQLQDKIQALILATDITRQQDYLGQFKVHIDRQTLDLTLADHRLLVLQMALKCADISNPCRSWDISRTWSLKVCEEFFRQGDIERRLDLPLTPLCDRHAMSVSNIQTGFFKYVVTPLITEWHRFLQSDLSEQMLNNLVTNHKNWETYEIEKPEGQQTPEAVAEAEEEHETPNLSSSSELLLPRRSSLTPARPSTFREQLRRFSVPLNVFQDGRSRNRDAVIARGANGGVNEDDADYEQAPEYCSDKLLAESSIASITTPAEAMRMCHVFHERNWKLIRQPTFPPLEMMSRAHSLIPRASSQGESIYPRAVKSDSGIRLESNHDDHRLGSRPESRIGSRLRDNLVFIPLDLGRRRKSMPARAEPMTPLERRFRELREVLPSMIQRTLSPRAAGPQARRGSAPAPGSEERGRARASNLGSPVHALPRRSSLPLEMRVQLLSD